MRLHRLIPAEFHLNCRYADCVRKKSKDIDVVLEIYGYCRGKNQYHNVDKVAAIQSKIAGYGCRGRPLGRRVAIHPISPYIRIEN